MADARSQAHARAVEARSVETAVVAAERDVISAAICWHAGVIDAAALRAAVDRLALANQSAASLRRQVAAFDKR